MRGEYLRQILGGSDFKVINTDVPMEKTGRLSKSLAWRYKIGPFISNINNYIVDSLQGDFNYDLVWIDKGVFIKPSVIAELKKNSGILVHFTPDPAFSYHRSKLFFEALPLYDVCITTKSFEVDNYQSYGVRTILCTQGYDPALHKPYHKFEEKSGIVFIGHVEEERAEMVARIVEADLPITVAGNHWDKFCTSPTSFMGVWQFTASTMPGNCRRLKWDWDFFPNGFPNCTLRAHLKFPRAAQPC